MIQHSLPFQAACDCGICTDCFEDAYDSACKKQHPCLGSAKDNLSEFHPNEDVKSLWCSICYHIQTYVTRRLIGDNEVLSPKRGLVHDTNWESYFEMLRLLFVSGQVQRIHHWSLAKDVAMRPSLGMTWHDLSDSYISNSLTAAEGTLSTLLASQAAIQAKSHSTADKEQHFLVSMLSVLMLCDCHAGKLTSVLVSVIEKLDGWQEFESTSLGKASSKVLLSTLYDILHSSAQLDEVFGSRLDSEINLECTHIADEMIAHALQLPQQQKDELLRSHDCDQRVLNCLDMLAGLLIAEK
ncbi:hypothetical protein HPB50_005475 [Hyalomma asiaticum]|uniref:Uncharacterized protein n=1 Tax=Hyalomma asiaticum TaxID=266040 RepID=A0ACB7SSY8_HYAAI|nr:hypothetical protein HPB50_005475 [Hyalomma asiaticum]